MIEKNEESFVQLLTEPFVQLTLNIYFFLKNIKLGNKKKFGGLKPKLHPLPLGSALSNAYFRHILWTFNSSG